MSRFIAIAICIISFITSLLIYSGKLDFIIELRREKVSSIKFERLVWALFCLFFAIWGLMSVFFDWPKLAPESW